MTGVAALAAVAEATDKEILGHFESLGDNCEFGLVQRAAGVEQLGFFRFNFAEMPGLLKALDSAFADMDQPGSLIPSLSLGHKGIG